VIWRSINEQCWIRSCLLDNISTLSFNKVGSIQEVKLTQEIIDQIQEAMLHTKKDGTVNWKDTDEIVVQLAGTFAADRFIVIKNRTKDPVISAAPHPDFDYERKVFTKDGREQYMKEYATQRLHNDIKKAK